MLDKTYDPKEIEARRYPEWEQGGAFRAHPTPGKPPYCIVIPPPNVTGSLHMGHALDNTLQDVLIRWRRMKGDDVLWQPGTDHAGIATQMVVVRNLEQEGIGLAVEGAATNDANKKLLNREEFLAKVWEWKAYSGGTITGQLRRLGASCDWSRERFTMDEGLSKAVLKVFVELYKEGLIYKDLRLVNWDPKMLTAISDLEVESREVKGHLWYFKYPIEGSPDEFIVVATTRPETMLGDTGIAVHPDDPKWKHLIGKHAVLPLVGRRIAIVGDEYSDPEKGSGAVKITPAHDFNDFEVGRRHDLEAINIFDKFARVNDKAPEKYRGLDRFEARKIVVAEMEELGLVEKIEPHTHAVPYGDRGGVPVEPFLTEQWYADAKKLAEAPLAAARDGRVKFVPERGREDFFRWMENIEPWCVSRQLWWGHQIPAWYGPDKKVFVALSEEEAKAEARAHYGKDVALERDPDVLDTWFSSALWPFSTLGWPDQTPELAKYYPTSTLVTGWDILFFWVARMMMMGLEFMRDVPFRKVYLHGIVRDSQGRKMSKSLGNSVDPVDMIEKYGADALRFSFLAHIHSGKDFKFSEQRTEGYRNFMNKIWNATRFSLTNLQDFKVPAEGTAAMPDKAQLTAFDQWIITKLGRTEKTVEEALEQDRFSDAATALYSFVWYEFCDWYIEFIKPVMNGPAGSEKQNTQLVLAQVLNRVMRLLHPFVPFISEELYQKLPIKGEACIVDKYPNTRNDRELLALGSDTAAYEVEILKEVISAIRNVRGENRISPAIKINVRVSPSDAKAQKVLLENRNAIVTMGRLENLDISAEGSLSKCAVVPVAVDGSQMQVIIPLEGLVDIDEEIKRIQKSVEKLNKDIAGLSGRLSNENFVKNAAEDVVEADRKMLEQNKAQLSSLQDALKRLQS
ncbi:MAG: valine--tRNA ligase [Proteobacteria bacterium]|nr:valine--tRNA ligase [Pseudomonadota bacterium]